MSITLCLSYGKAGHPRAQFKFRNYTSHSHSKNGQITGACRSNTEKVHKIGRPELPEVSLSDSVDLFSFSPYNVNLGRHDIEVSVELNGTPLLMERDTSVSVFLIS